MTGDPIEFTRAEALELLGFMREATQTLKRIEVQLDDHEERIRATEKYMHSQKGASAWSRWAAPVLIAIAALVISAWTAFKRS